MIKDLRENDLGFMVGTFYSSIFKYDIEVLFDRDISLEYIEKNIEYFNSIKQEFLFDIFLLNPCITLAKAVQEISASLVSS